MDLPFSPADSSHTNNTLKYISMIENQTQKWISDAAYFISLNREARPGQEVKDWLAAEQQYYQKMKKRVKTGLVRII